MPSTPAASQCDQKMVLGMMICHPVGRYAAWGCVATGLVWALGLATVSAAEPANQPEFTAEQIEHFEKHIRPLLIQHCVECHGPKEQNGELRMDGRAMILKGGDHGPGIVVGKPQDSLIIRAIKYSSNDLQMPPDGKLPAEAVAALETWIATGAAWPAEDVTEIAKLASPTSPESIAAAREKHWAFQPIREPAVPAVKQRDWPQSPIDHFILAKLEEQSLAPVPVADRRTLIRRAKFDLLGLPATLQEIAEFEADASPDAFAKVIDRFLAMPEYGQRRGRYWLDVARYADTKGYVFQEERRYPFAYTYRDYVVRAFNEDLPYNRFIVEQLAADQLELGEDKRPLAAMGFLTLGRRFLNNQHDIIDDRLDTVSRGLLGLTVACARCHDHKFDPIPTADYYSLYGVFASSQEPGDLPLIGEPQKTPGFAAYEKELQKREAAMAAYAADVQRKMQTAARTKVGDYLLAAYETRSQNGGQTANYAKGKDLFRTTLDRWKRRLTAAERKPEAVFAVWFALAKLDPKTFADQAPKVIAEHKQAADKRPAANAKLLAALEAAAPKTLAEVAAVYTKTLAEVETAWQAAQQEKREKLDDPASEELRQILYADDSPTNISEAEVVQLFSRDQRNKHQELRRKVEQLKASSPDAPPRAMALFDKPDPVKPRILKRGNPGNQGDEVPRQFLAVLTGESRAPFKKGSGRLELAESIASADNPLTARVYVNRVWIHHFGQGLVRTPSDFGIRSDPPTHPELLDYLAARFIAEGWSTKKLHRAIMLSRVYQLQSDAPAALVEKDYDNKYLARMNRRRLDWESLRDSLLAAAGRLDTALDGRPVELLTEPYTTRRTIYGFIDRQNLPNLFRAFDLASPDTTNAQRFETTVPQQALFMLNGKFVLEQARFVMRRPDVAEQSTPQGKAIAVYRAILARDPSPAELAMTLKFVGRAEEPDKDDFLVTVGWEYGYAQVEEAGVKEFQSLPHWTGTSWQGGPALPDPKLGWCILSASGGHPGDQPVVRRWIAPRSGSIKITGSLAHPSDKGDGVRGRVFSDRTGKLGEWVAQRNKVETSFDRIEVQAGEAIDFVVDCRSDTSFDSFEWAPVVKMVEEKEQLKPGMPTEWNASKDFQRAAPLGDMSYGPWERLAQALLLTNEFAFAD